MLETLTVNTEGATPAYLQLRQSIMEAIQANALRPGEALPSERKLADTLGLSRMTVRRAFDELIAEGVLERRPGSGTFIKPRRVEQMVDRVLGFTDEVQNLGMKPLSVVLDVEYEVSDAEVSHHLGLDGDAKMFKLARLRLTEQGPLAVQIAFLPPDYADLSLETLNRTGSLYATLQQQFDVYPSRAKQRITARLPSEREVTLLQLGMGAPVLAMERLTFDQHGQTMEFVRSAYSGERVRDAARTYCTLTSADLHTTYSRRSKMRSKKFL